MALERAVDICVVASLPRLAEESEMGLAEFSEVERLPEIKPPFGGWEVLAGFEPAISQFYGRFKSAGSHHNTPA